MYGINQNFEYTTTICGVIFGVDESILNVKLPNDYMFKRMSLIPQKNNLDSLFETDAMGLRRSYESAKINDDLDVICIHKIFTIRLTQIEAEEYYSKMSYEAIVETDRLIRAIRLFFECNLFYKQLSVQMKSKEYLINGTSYSSNFGLIFPVGEALGTKVKSIFSYSKIDIEILNAWLLSFQFPESELLMNCIGLYDLSYHQEDFVSLTLLIACLEMLFLDSESYKKEKLAKRCAVLLFEEKTRRLECFNRLREIYKNRSDFVHDGKFEGIKGDDVLFLRKCIRSAIIEFLNESYSKKNVLCKLKILLHNLDYWSI